MATERRRRRTAGGAEIVEQILERIAALKANSGDSHGKHPRG